MHKLAMVVFGLLVGIGNGTGVEQAEGVARQAPTVETYAVVVNANNPTKDTGDVAKKAVKALFLKDLSRWSDGVEAKPFARDANAPEQVAFVKEVLGMSAAELARHWLKQKNMNGLTPPTEVDSDRMLLKHVARHDGAFGVVKAQHASASGVKVLFEFKSTQ